MHGHRPSTLDHRAAPISIATSFDYDIPFDAQVPLIAAAGFTHLSLGVREDHSNYRSAAGRAQIARLLSANGLAMDTIHGPRIDQPGSAEVLADVIDAAASLGAGVVAVHVSPFDFPQSELAGREANVLHICESIGPVAAAAGVRIALENVLPGHATELVTRVLERLDPMIFGACYDSAHDQIGGPRPFTLLETWRGRVIAVQLSDRIRDFVDHVLPGEGFIDWRELCESLRRSGFDAPVLLEVATTHSAEKDPVRFLNRAGHCARQIAAALSCSATDSP